MITRKRKFAAPPPAPGHRPHPRKKASKGRGLRSRLKAFQEALDVRRPCRYCGAESRPQDDLCEHCGAIVDAAQAEAEALAEKLGGSDEARQGDC